MPRFTPSNSRLYKWLLVLFFVAFDCQALFTVDVIRDLSSDYPESPVYTQHWPVVAGVRTQPPGADVQPGDRVVAINGREAQRQASLAAAIRSARPGETLRITFERGGRRTEVAYKLRATVVQATAFLWFFAIVSWILMPWLCIGLGFWVAFLRPRDSRAWLLLGMLLGMSAINRPAILDPLGWPSPYGLFAFVYRELAVLAWPICMMLFGFYFPQRWRFDRRAPYVKWLLIVPVGILGAWGIASTVSARMSSDGGMAPPPVRDAVFTGWIMVMLGLFFIALSDKYRDQDLAADERRRLRLLYGGATVAMTPSFLLFLYTLLVHHRTPGDQDGVWLVIGIMAMTIFPIAMAYAIVVHRAMDVRMVIRQGMQYALAQRGIRIIQGCLIVGIAVVSVSLLGSGKLSRPNQFTLIAMGIFVALRIRALGDRLRVWVDKRFFREAYNSEQILSDLSEQVRGILESDSLLQTVMRKISESLHVDRVAVLLQQNGVFRPALAVGYATTPDLAISAEFPPIDAMRQKRAPVAVESGEDAAALRQLDSQLLLPLASRKELLGFISLGPKRSEEPYSHSDTVLLRTVAAQTGLALENARLSEAIAAEVAQRELLNREIEIAREVQQRLFPQTLPEVPALEYAGHCRPARGVGGDYYDFLALASGCLGIAIGDVSGKGVPAALLMASLQASVRGQSQAESGRVAELMTNVNRLVCDASPENRYATFFYGQFDPATRKLVYANGGHNPPMLLRGEELLRLEDGGPPVGLFRIAQYVQEEIQLHPGDLLVFFTDGISEAENPAQEEWGEDALVATARAAGEEPAAAAIQRIMDAADTFAAGAPQHDDMTLVVARVM